MPEGAHPIVCTAYTPAKIWGLTSSELRVGVNVKKFYTGGSHRLAKYVRQYKFMIFQNINNR